MDQRPAPTVVLYLDYLRVAPAGVAGWPHGTMLQQLQGINTELVGVEILDFLTRRCLYNMFFQQIVKLFTMVDNLTI